MNVNPVPELDALGYRRFNPQELPSHPAFCVCSIRRSGKSVLISHVIADIRKRYDEVFLFSTTAALQDNVFGFIPDINRFDFVDVEKIEEIVAKQEKMLKYNKTVAKPNQIKNDVLILMDDIVTDSGSRSPIVKSLYIKGRHIHVSCMLLAQAYRDSNQSGVSKINRLNSDVIISFCMANSTDRNSFIEENLSIIDKKEGRLIFDEITKHEYTAIVIELYKLPTARSYRDYVSYLRVDADKMPRKFLIEKPDLHDSNRGTNQVAPVIQQGGSDWPGYASKMPRRA